MNDTPPHVEKLFRTMIMQRSPEERFMMGIEMFETARAIVLASLPADISPAETSVRLLERFYGNDFDEKTLTDIKSRIRQKHL